MIVIGAGIWCAIIGTALGSPSPSVVARIQAAIRAFRGTPGAIVAMTSGPRFTRHGYQYHVAVHPEMPGSSKEYDVFQVDVATGDVTSFDPGASIPRPFGKPTLGEGECRAIARKFAQDHFRGFSQKRMRLLTTSLSGNEDLYTFTWRETLNSWGTLAPYELNITVVRATGRVLRYDGPLPRIYGPTVPRVSRERAQQIATALAPWDPADYPFWWFELEVWSDEIGMHYLRWHIIQDNLGTTGLTQGRWFCEINAITGQVNAGPDRFGEAAPRIRQPTMKVRHSSPARVWRHGIPVHLNLGCEIRDGRAFVPIGLAQLFGWRPVAAAGKQRPRMLEKLDGSDRVRISGDVLPGGQSPPGQLFVPARWLAKTVGLPVRWEPDTGRVHFDPPVSPTFPRPR